jgi:hypothetical protein
LLVEVISIITGIVVGLAARDRLVTETEEGCSGSRTTGTSPTAGLGDGGGATHGLRAGVVEVG